jgi:hypothetical protein
MLQHLIIRIATVVEHISTLPSLVIEHDQT